MRPGLRQGPEEVAPTRVLVVEDDDDVRRSVCDILRRCGYDVAEAFDGQAAIDILGRQEAFDAVILDLFMPRVDGAGVLDALAPEPVVLVHSAFEYRSLAEAKANYGARVSAYLTKPVPPLDLLRALEKGLATRN